MDSTLKVMQKKSHFFYLFPPLKKRLLKLSIQKTVVEPKVNFEHPQNKPKDNNQRRRSPTAKSFRTMKPMCIM